MSILDMVNTIKETYNFKDIEEIDGAYYFSNNDFYISLIDPHSGTDYLYCLRADFPQTFDRWSSSLFEELFDVKDFDTVIHEIHEFYENREEIIKEELA